LSAPRTFAAADATADAFLGADAPFLVERDAAARAALRLRAAAAVVRFRLTAAGFRFPRPGFRIPPSGFRLPASLCRLPAARFRLTAVRRAFPVPTFRLLPVLFLATSPPMADVCKSRVISLWCGRAFAPCLPHSR
jgi:hypothetical protein